MKKLILTSTLSLALLSGVAFAQDAMQQGAEEFQNNAERVATEAENDVGRVLNEAVNDVGRVVNEAIDNIGRAGGEATASTEMNAGSDHPDEIDPTTSASIQANSSLSLTLDALGPRGDAFFTDASRATVADDEQFAAAFRNLDPEQRERLRTSCDEASGTAFCASLSRI